MGSREELIEEVMYCGVAELRRNVQDALNELPPETSPLDRIMTAVEAHLRHELEISDYATASIRNSGQIPSTSALDNSKRKRATDGYGADCLTMPKQTGKSGPISTSATRSCWLLARSTGRPNGVTPTRLRRRHRRHRSIVGEPRAEPAGAITGTQHPKGAHDNQQTLRRSPLRRGWPSF